MRENMTISVALMLTKDAPVTSDITKMKEIVVRIFTRGIHGRENESLVNEFMKLYKDELGEDFPKSKSTCCVSWLLLEKPLPHHQ
jgi:hypothetical protein